MEELNFKIEQLKDKAKFFIVLSIIEMALSVISVIIIWCIPVESLTQHITTSFGILCFFWLGAFIHLKGIEKLQLAKHLEAEYEKAQGGNENGN